MRDFAPFLGLPLWVWLFVLPTALVAVAGLNPDRARPILTPLWRLLDRVYVAAGVLAAVGMILILLLIVAQMIARWSSVAFPGSTDYAGYAMAATSFFALAHAMTRGAHIRVSVLLNLTEGTRFWLDAFATFMAALIATYFARFAIKTNALSAVINDRTQGQDQVPEWLLTGVQMLGTWPWHWAELWAASGEAWVFTPLWLPQIPMSIGTVLLAVCLWDYLARLVVTGRTAIVKEGVE
ncbi:MAG: TRAP transporter small permease subunit [Pseudomonadota bacterium]